MKILGAIVMVAILSLFASYTIAMYGAVDEGVDLTGTDYEDQYETQTDMMLINQSVMSPIPLIFGAIVLLGAVGLMYKSTH